MVGTSTRVSADEQLGRPAAGRRGVQSRATREAIIEAAEQLFRRDGYAGTTITAIARGAGAAVQTVYNSVGSKAAVLSAVLDRSASGEQGRPVIDFLAERLDQADSAPAVVDVLADWFAEVNPRTLDIHRVIHQAAGVDAEIAELQQRRAMQRLERYRRLEPKLRAQGALRPGLDADRVSATVWAIGSPASYEALVVQAGWSLAEYRDWVADSLRAALLAG